MSLNGKPFSNRFVKKALQVTTVPRGTKKDDIQDKQIVNLKKKFRKLNTDMEIKSLDVYFNPRVSDTTGTAFTLLNGIAQGVTAVTRIGNNVRLTSLHLKVNVNTETDNLKASVARLLVFIDKQSNLADPPVLSGGSGAALLDWTVIQNIVCAPYSHKTIYSRYKILIDKVIILNPQTVQNFNVATGTTQLLQQATKHINKKVKLNYTVEYGGTGATVASIASGAVHLCLVTTDVSTESLSISGGCRINFKDI